MKIIYTLLIVSIYVSACSKYQYFTIASPKQAETNDSIFINENDSIKIIYRFNGINGPVKISVLNKTDIPIYINWAKSAIIMNNQALSFYTGEVKLNGYNQSTQLNWTDFVSTTNGSFNAKGYIQQGVDFLPPKSFKENNSFTLVDGFFNKIDMTNSKKIRYFSFDPRSVKIRKKDFSFDDSPFKFRIYITYAMGSETLNEKSMERGFYLSEVFTTFADPSSLYFNHNQGNTFYTGTSTNFSKIAGTAAVIGVVGFLIDNQHRQNNNQKN